VRQRSAGSLLPPCFQPQMPYTRSCVLLPSSVPQVNAYDLIMLYIFLLKN
jgi:hypothetical protein